MKYIFKKDWQTGSAMTGFFKWKAGDIVDGANVSMAGGMPSFRIYENGHPVATVSGIGILQEYMPPIRDEARPTPMDEKEAAFRQTQSDKTETAKDGIAPGDVKDGGDKKIDPKEKPAAATANPNRTRNIVLAIVGVCALAAVLRWKKII